MRTVDLYSGMGGLSLGLMNAGFELVAAFDNWRFAVDLYRKNFTHRVYQLDISKQFDTVLKLLADIKPETIVAGPPCQDFSHAGKRNENLGRGEQTLVFAHIIKRMLPQYFLMENVDRVATTQKYRMITAILKEAGYGLSERIIDASLCRVPQRRRRLFLCGRLDDRDNFLDDYIDASLASEHMTLRDYFGDSLRTEHYYRHPRNYSRRAVFSIDEPSPTIRGVNRPIPRGYPGHAGDTETDRKKIRPLTTAERAQVQTFPPNFVLTGAKTSLEQAIGNAVPVSLAEFVGQALLKYEQRLPPSCT